MIIPLQKMTEGAARVAATDPHGWTLTVISVSVVFIALLVLFCVYSASGKVFTGNFRRKKSDRCRGDEVTAAIAAALQAELSGGTELEAAIATALELDLGAGAHDIEPGIVTIRKTVSDWDNKALNFRKQITK